MPQQFLDAIDIEINITIELAELRIIIFFSFLCNNNITDEYMIVTEEAMSNTKTVVAKKLS